MLQLHVLTGAGGVEWKLRNSQIDFRKRMSNRKFAPGAALSSTELFHDLCPSCESAVLLFYSFHREICPVLGILKLFFIDLNLLPCQEQLEAVSLERRKTRRSD
jgi:hypothetical protein